MKEPETFWAAILSREPEKIRAVWQKLDADERAAVGAHLRRMVHEEGWSEPQRRSAQAALDAIDAPDDLS